MSFDLLFRGQEITSGGRRINDYATLVDSMRRFGLEPGSDEPTTCRYSVTAARRTAASRSALSG